MFPSIARSPRACPARHQCPTPASSLVLPPLSSRDTIELQREEMLRKRKQMDDLYNKEFGKERGRPLDREDLQFFTPERMTRKEYTEQLDDFLTMNRARN